MGTFQGFGTDYRGWSEKYSDGSNTATLWVVMLWLPVVPRFRDTVVVLRQRAQGATSLTTTYSILKREPVRIGEVLRTYVMWWLVLPLPLVFAFVVALNASEAAVPCLVLTSSSVFAMIILMAGRRHQRRMGVPVERG
jgi:hypothetical protein